MGGGGEGIPCHVHPGSAISAVVGAPTLGLCPGRLGLVKSASGARIGGCM